MAPGSSRISSALDDAVGRGPPGLAVGGILEGRRAQPVADPAHDDELAVAQSGAPCTVLHAGAARAEEGLDRLAEDGGDAQRGVHRGRVTAGLRVADQLAADPGLVGELGLAETGALTGAT